MSRTVLAAHVALAAFLMTATGAMAGDLIVDLNELNPSPSTYWNGSDLSGGFTSGRTFFQNAYDTNYFSWGGFAYSRVNDPTTPGWGNQYAVASGTGFGGTGTYAVAFDSAWDEQDIVTLPTPGMVRGFYVNNTTYAALDMRNGSAYSKKFGGPSGNDPDWFKLTVTGQDENGETVGSVQGYLADFRSANNGQDYIMTDWTWLDCSSLGPRVKTLRFSLSSSDNGFFGMNTPSYFALDNLTLACGPMPVTTDLDILDPGASGYWKGTDFSGAFHNQGVRFQNSYEDTYGSWSGFAYSRVNDTNTPGYGNQFAVISGSDVSGDGIYAIGFDSAWDEQDIVTLPTPSTAKGLYINNTTYATFDMLLGGLFSKVFGGPTGDDPDWFMLTITGKDGDGTSLGSSQVYLADYRFTNNVEDYIVQDWTWVDLSSIGPGVETLHFTLSSSDNGDYGMNTPAYFALDDLMIEPSFSGGAASDSPWDAGIPGFVGPDGTGSASGISNSVNPIFGAWASEVVDYAPTADVSPDFTNATLVLGPVTGDHFSHIASLGDLDDAQIAAGDAPGSITLGFPVVIADQAGPDFAVFENGLIETNSGLLFAEFGYVEVSSDGTNFARFPTRSYSTNTVGAYDTLHPETAYNVCGKHANANGNSWGTPFDLATLACHPSVQAGTVDLDGITQVRIVDIPGSGDFFDHASTSNAIFDPWVTFGSGGVDLEAVGVINSPQLVHVKVVSGPHGQVTPYGLPGGLVTLPTGDPAAFMMTPEDGFHIGSVQAGGVDMGRTNFVDLPSVTADTDIWATFGHRLTVISPNGTADPGAGEHYSFGPSALTMTTPIVTAGGTQAVCTGWVGTGSLTSGVGTATGTFDFTNDTTVSWLWETNYALTVAATAGGQVDHNGGWYAAGSIATSTAASDPYFSFTGWSGQTAGDTNLPSMPVVMDGARSLIANFYAPLTTNGTPVGWLEHYKLTNGTPDEVDSVDGDLDGEDTWREFLAGTDPTDRDSRFAIINQGCVDGTNFVTWLGGTNGSALPFSVYATGTLTGQWELVDGTVSRAPSGTNTWWHDCTNGASYYRVVVEP